MRSVTTARFRRCLADLPPAAQARARAAYALFARDPSHPSPRLKQVHATRPIYSARVGRALRALGTLDGGTMIWFWVGSHDDYERLLQSP